jgi:hypothetical protein
MRLRCRDAGKRPGFIQLSLIKRGWRAEKRKSYGSCLAGRGRLSARQSRRLFDRAALSGFAGGRSNAPPSSASSWQGLLVVPGGAPAPPE